MKLFNRILVISALSLSALPIVVHAGDADPCAPVFDACVAQGYARDETAPVGKKIWLNCAAPILNSKRAVPQVDIDPNGFDANNCRDYRKAKDKFDAEWAKKHPRL